MDADEINGLTERVIGAILEVSNTLGAGFLEKVYERTLVCELRLRGIQAVAQVSFPVVYKGESVGEYFADTLVEGVVEVELKCAERFAHSDDVDQSFRTDADQFGAKRRRALSVWNSDRHQSRLF